MEAQHKKYGSNPMISVIMAVYNQKKEILDQAVESILNQTYTNFEFIKIGRAHV